MEIEISKVSLAVGNRFFLAVNCDQWQIILKLGLSIATTVHPRHVFVYVSMNFLSLETP